MKKKEKKEKKDYLLFKPWFRRLTNFIAILLIPILTFWSVFSLPGHLSKYDSNRFVYKYISEYAKPLKVNDFRQEMTDEESQKDYDGDKITNAEELNLNLNIYNYDTDNIGVNDAYKRVHQEDAGIKSKAQYRNAIEQAQLEQTDIEKQIVSAIVPKSRGSATCYLEEDINMQGSKHPYALTYYGIAFQSFNRVFMPFRLFNYTGEVQIQSDFLKRLNGSMTLYLLSYDVKKDRYTIDPVVIYGDNIIGFDITDNDDIYCVIGDNTQQIINDAEYYSMRLSVLKNRLKNRAYEYAVSTGLTGASRITFFDNENSFHSTDNKRFMQQSASKNGYVSFRMRNYTDVDHKMLSKYLQTNEPGSLQDLYYTLKYGDDINQVTLTGDNLFQRYVDGFADSGFKVKTINTKSTGFTDYKLPHGFSVEANEFSFGNFTSETCPNGVALAMADTVSYYYNNHTLPASEDGEINQEATEAIGKGDISSNLLTASTPLMSDRSVNVIRNTPLQKYLEQRTTELYNTYYTKKAKHSNQYSVLNHLKEEIEKGKTVVAYMKNGNKMTAVVVYAIARDVINTDEWVLKVYDPNFPHSKVSVFDKRGNALNVDINTKIRLYLKPNATVNNKKYTPQYTFRFEYGVTPDYCWGNTGHMKDGQLYLGGDICFVKPTDQSDPNRYVFLN